VSMRVAVLGLGFMGSTHVKAWRNVEGVDLAAVYSSDPKKLEGDLSEIQGNLGTTGEKLDFSSVRKYQDIDKLLADPEIDSVDICLPTNLHSSVALAALRAGKNVLVEKPLALSGDIADEIIAEAKNRKLTLMGAQVLRFIPAYRALHEALRNNGSPVTVHSAIFRRRCAAPFWNKWLGDASKSGGGVFDLLIHDVDMAIFIFGLPAEVSATGYEELAGGVDTLNATLYYPNGTTIGITGGWHHKKAYPFSMDFTVVSQQGTYEYSSQLNEGALTLYTTEGEVQPVPLSTEDGFEAELRYFASCCSSGSYPAFCPPEQSAAAVRLTQLLLDARTKNGEKIVCDL
jgi:predicted dehydrogenase